MFIQQSATFHMLHAAQPRAKLGPLQNTSNPQCNHNNAAIIIVN